MDILLVDIRPSRFNLGCDSPGLGYFFGMKPFSFQHVQEICVSSGVELVGSVDGHSPVEIKIDQCPVENGGSQLRFYVVSDDGKVSLFKPFLPVPFTGNKNRNTIDEGAFCLQHLFDIPFCGLLTSDGEIIDDNIGMGVLEDPDDIRGRTRSFLDDLRKVFSEAVVSHSPFDFDFEMRNFGKLGGSIRRSENRLTEVFTHFIFIDIKGRHEFDIADRVSSQVDVHDSWNIVCFFGIFVIFNALDQSRRTVSDTNYSDSNFTHSLRPPFLAYSHFRLF